MPYTKTSWVANVTPVTAVSMNNIEAGIASLSAPAPSATPPASPADGDIWYYPVVSGGIWQFRYNAGSASAYKWEFVGGTPGFSAVYASEALAVAGWVNANPTIGPDFTVPRAGDYLCDATTVFVCSSQTSLFQLGVASVSAGAGTPIGSTAIWSQLTVSAYTQLTIRAQTPGVAGVLRVIYNTSGAPTTVSGRTLYVTPIRVS